MTRPNIPARLSFDSRGINNASADYCPRLFTIAPGHANDQQTQALGYAFAAVPALLEALEHLANDQEVGFIARSALIAAGYQF